MIISKFYFKNNGSKIIPHMSLISDLPYLFKDGVLFIFQFFKYIFDNTILKLIKTN
jgi:hypothetical protein